MKLGVLGFSVAALGLLTLAWAQDGGLTARQLYYGSTDASDGADAAKGKSAQKAAPASQPAKVGKASQPTKSSQATSSQTPSSQNTKAAPQQEKSSPNTTSGASSGAASSAGGQSGGGPSNAVADSQPARLGMRYSLLKVDTQTGNAVEVDPDQNFAPGDCFAVRLRPNRNGRIYVFNRSSSGGWQTLLPSAEMPDESNEIRDGASITVPRGYCFGLDDPPGVDTLLVALTDRADDMNQLDNYIQASDPAPAQPRPRPAPANSTVAGAGGGQPQLVASAAYDQMLRVTNVINQGQGMVSRDVVIQKIANRQSQEEPPNSVYIVKTAAATQDRLVIEIPIRHERQ